MKIIDLFGKGTQEKENADKELYVKLCAEEFSRRPYEKEDLKDGMYVVNQSIGGYWKPRFLVDERNKTAVEIMNEWTILLTVCADDIDWKSLEGLPSHAIDKAKRLNASFPTFVKNYKDDVAEMSWQINPDGRYYMDEDGYGMTNDEEITIYSYVDRAGKPLVCFRNINDYAELNQMEEEARKNLKRRK